MLTVVIALISLISPQSNHLRTDYNALQESNIGKTAREAFLHPDTVTVQRIYPLRGPGSPPRTSHPRMMSIGREKFVPLKTVHVVPAKTATAIVSALSKPDYFGQTKCTFHPDHLLTFKKGKTILQVITCFHCNEIIAGIGGAQKGRGSFAFQDPAMQSLWNLGTAEDESRAFYGEYMVEEIVDALKKAKSGTLQYATRSAQSTKPEDVKFSKPKALNAQLVTKIVSAALQTPSRDNKDWEPIPNALKERSDGWRITLKTTPKIILTCGTGSMTNEISLAGKAYRWYNGAKVASKLTKELDAAVKK